MCDIILLSWRASGWPVRRTRSFWQHVGDGHRLYVQVVGEDDAAQTVLVLHGGPGAGSSPADATIFPEGIRIVIFDQRGAGRSRPQGATHKNDVDATLGDIEQLRVALGVERWVIFGRSWGAYLALRYGMLHPRRCQGLLLFGLFWPTGEAIKRLYQEPAPQVIAEWQALMSLLAPDERLDVLAAFARRMGEPRMEARYVSAAALTQYQNACTWTGRPRISHREPPGPLETIAYATVQLYFASRGFFHGERALRDVARALSGVPAELVHGNADLVSALHASRELAELWGSANLVIVPDGPHAAFEEANLGALRSSAAQLVNRLTLSVL
jgi:proline iminopeptidase